MRWLYRKIVPESFLVRINDFDNGLAMDVDIRADTGLSLWHFPDLYEKEEREIFCSSIGPGSTVLDVGANFGFYTLLAAKRGARVFAIEPDPFTAAMLRRNIEINGFDRCVTVFEVAVTDRNQAVGLFRHPFNLGESNIIGRGQPTVMVEGRTLDSLGLPPIDVCKMDAEGSELLALRGMQQTLARSPSLKLLIEYNRELGSGPALLEYLKANFSTLKVIGSPVSASVDEAPAFCNLIATRMPKP